MQELVKKTLHILIEVKHDFLDTINKEYVEDEEFQLI